LKLKLRLANTMLIGVATASLHQGVYASELIDPGILINRTAAAQSFGMARDLYKECIARTGIAGGLPPKQAKAMMNIFTNLCTCNANAAGRVWEDYGKNDLAASMAMLKRIEPVTESCKLKYVTPYRR
jgi:hypothetical protein